MNYLIYRCDCGRVLYSKETAKTKKCTCGKTLNVKKRRILKIIKKMYKEKVLQERKDNNSDK